MIEVLLLIAACLLSVAASALFSGVEMGIYCLDRVRLEVRAEQGDRRARRLARLMERSDELVTTTLLGTNLADYAASATLAALLTHMSIPEARTELYTTLVLTPVILVFGGVVPKDWFRRRSSELMLALSTLLSVCRQLAVVTGLPWVMRVITRGLIRLLDPGRADQEGLVPRVGTLRLLTEGAARGGLSAFQRAVIERVLRVSRVRVSQIMVPRPRTAHVPITIAREDLLRIARMAHFSRLPVYEGDPRRIVGIVNVYDVLMDEQPRPVRDYVRPALRIPAATTVPEALVKLQKAHQVMAIVVNDKDEFLGLFTMKDLVEEIVGELEVW